MDANAVALWLVCGLGSAAWAVLRPRTTVTAGLALLAFAAAAWWSVRVSAPSLTVVGSFVAVCSGLWIARPATRVPPLVAAGLLAGLSLGAPAGTLPPGTAGGAALALFGVLALAGPCAAVLIGDRRRRFAPADLVEDALGLLVVVGLVSAAWPVVAEGWQAAGNLQVSGSAPAGAVVMPVWVLSVSATALLGGGVYSLWSRR